ncbi:hypothetical protein ACX80E_08120 [Arthrobacter sp. TMN-49]
MAAGIKFPDAAQITRKSRHLGTLEWSTENVYIITSLTLAQGKPELIGSLICGHCGIENGLRWRRDVTWCEDASQVRRGQRTPCYGLPAEYRHTILRLDGETNLAKATRGARNYPCRALKIAGLSTS